MEKNLSPVHIRQGPPRKREEAHLLSTLGIKRIGLRCSKGEGVEGAFLLCSSSRAGDVRTQNQGPDSS